MPSLVSLGVRNREPESSSSDIRKEARVPRSPPYSRGTGSPSQRIRQEKERKGIRISKEEAKLSGCAEDILL